MEISVTSGGGAGGRIEANGSILRDVAPRTRIIGSRNTIIGGSDFSVSGDHNILRDVRRVQIRGSFNSVDTGDECTLIGASNSSKGYKNVHTGSHIEYVVTPTPTVAVPAPPPPLAVAPPVAATVTVPFLRDLFVAGQQRSTRHGLSVDEAIALLSRDTRSPRLTRHTPLGPVPGAGSSRRGRRGRGRGASTPRRRRNPVPVDSLSSDPISLDTGELDSSASSDDPALDRAIRASLASDTGRAAASVAAAADDESKRILPPLLKDEPDVPDHVREKLSPDAICIICAQRAVTTAFVPCGHAKSCTHCLYAAEEQGNLTKCWECRQELNKTTPAVRCFAYADIITSLSSSSSSSATAASEKNT